jgi:Tfp pilus assembly protein PilF
MTMKKLLLPRIAPLLGVLLVLPAAASAESHGRLIGKVVDNQGHPIAGVTVTTTCSDIMGFQDVETTNDRGIFMVDFPQVDVLYRHSFEKTGYVGLKIDQRWTTEGTERHEFKMYPAEAMGTEAGPPVSKSAAAIAAFNAGAVAFKAKDWATAATKFEEAVGHDPNLRQAWAALSEARVEQKRYEDAATAADKAIALGATEEPVMRARWEAYRHLGDEAKTAQARADLEKYSRLTEEAKRIHNEAVALVKAGDDAGAYARFKEALSIDPNLEPALIGLAGEALKTGHAAEAMAAAETVLKADSGNGPAIRLRYNAALQLGDAAAIADALVALAAIDRPAAVENLYKLANAAYDKDDTATAKDRVLKVLAIDPDYPQAHYLLGFLLMREGKKQEAKTQLERYLALAPNDPNAHIAKETLAYLK